MKFFAFILALATTALTSVARAEGEPAEVRRVGGDYKVEKVDKISDRAFAIEFRSEKPTGKYDVLRLESDHVHVAVKVGQTLRLSAEILSEKGPVAEVSQVVLFLPNPAGRVPVWLLSNKAPSGDLRGTKYLEMHSPLSDYSVM